MYKQYPKIKLKNEIYVYKIAKQASLKDPSFSNLLSKLDLDFLN